MYITPTPEKAFKNAIKKGMKNPENYMYMYSDYHYDHFKHIDTREYVKYGEYSEYRGIG